MSKNRCAFAVKEAPRRSRKKTTRNWSNSRAVEFFRRRIILASSFLEIVQKRATFKILLYKIKINYIAYFTINHNKIYAYGILHLITFITVCFSNLLISFSIFPFCSIKKLCLIEFALRRINPCKVCSRFSWKKSPHVFSMVEAALPKRLTHPTPFESLTICSPFSVEPHDTMKCANNHLSP